MRAKDFITEIKQGKVSDYQERAIPGAKTFPRIDQGYGLYRFGLAMASSPEDNGSNGVHELNNRPVTLCYTKQEEDIINKALKKLGLSSQQITSNGSQEPKDTNKTSPMPARDAVKRKNK
tara:strand:+ start:84 stop:443 length:360 start_codon:yes stop_codon:yes gene_type:complete